MRKRLWILLTVAICVISGCVQLADYFPDQGKQLEENTQQNVTELKGKHYAKLNSIGCLNCSDAETAMSANNRGDFDTVDHLIREKRCFVIPTGTDIFINKRVKGDIVSARFKDSKEVFFTAKSNLAVE
jgi:hypothetical protein